MMGASLLARAAAAGDSRATAFAVVRGQPREAAVAALSPAAGAGNPDAMFALGLLGLRGQLLWEFLGPEADISAEDRAVIGESVRWLRAAAERGHPAAMARLASIPVLSDHERLSWLQRAAAGGAWGAASRYADRLDRLGRQDEAERWYRVDVEAGSAYAAGRLAELHERAGQAAQAAQFRRRAAELARPPFVGVAMADIEPIVITAVATTAVVPFVQTLASKVAEDAYAQARGLVARLFARNSPPGPYDTTPHRLLLVEDDAQPIELFIWADLSDEALRALGALDIADFAANRPGHRRIRLVWDATTSAWSTAIDARD